jgi:hypothetical protein
MKIKKKDKFLGDCLARCLGVRLGYLVGPCWNLDLALALASLQHLYLESTDQLC